MERGQSSAARPGWRGKTFWFLLGRLPKGTRPAGRNQAPKHLANRQELKTLIHRVLTACQAMLLFQDGEVTFPQPKKKTHTPFDGVRQSVPLARYYLVCMIKSRRISVLIFTR